MKSFIKNFSIYGVSSMITKMTGFFLVPLYTKLLTPSDYGNLFVLNSTYMVLYLLSVGGFENSFARWFFDNDEQEDRIKTTSAWMWSQSFINTLIILAFIPVSGFFISKFTTGLEYPLLTVMLFVTATLFYVVPSIYINYQRVIQKARRTVTFAISYSLTTTLLSVLFVVFFKLNVLGIGLSIFITNLVFTIIAILLLKEKIHFRFFSKKRALEMFKFSFPFIPALLSYWVLQSTDSYFIKLITNSSEQLGFFSLGLTIASAMYIFTSAFQQIWPSHIFNAYKSMSHEKFNATFAFFFELYTVVYLFLQFCLTMFSYNIIMIFSSNPVFQPSYKVVGLISLNTIIYSYLSFTVMGMTIKKVSAPLGVGLTISALLVAALNFVFIPPFGFVGSALATILACAPVPIYLFYRSQKLYHLKIPGLKIILLNLLAFLAVVYFIFNPIFFEGNLTDILFKSVLALLLGSVIFMIYKSKVKEYTQSVTEAKLPIGADEELEKVLS